MTAWKYEISLRVLKNISLVRVFSTREEKFPSGHGTFYILYKTNEIPNHFTLIVVRCERRDLLCSHSKGDIFTCEDIKFSRESSPGISLVFIQ